MTVGIALGSDRNSISYVENASIIHIHIQVCSSLDEEKNGYVAALPALGKLFLLRVIICAVHQQAKQ